MSGSESKSIICLNKKHFILSICKGFPYDITFIYLCSNLMGKLVLLDKYNHIFWKSECIQSLFLKTSNFDNTILIANLLQNSRNYFLQNLVQNVSHAIWFLFFFIVCNCGVGRGKMIGLKMVPCKLLHFFMLLLFSN